MKASALSNSTSNKNLKQLAKRFNLIVIPEDLVETRDRNAIKTDDCWPLATHRFRRTFAVFVARNMLGDVRYLRHHFKHWSIDMTLYYASDPLFDDSLLESALSARDQLQAAVLLAWLVDEKPLAGGRGSHIMKFRGRSTVKTAKNPAALAKAVGDGVFIRGTGHSWCLATSTGCGGEGIYDAIRCVKCSESVIDQSHVGIWKEIRVQQIETLSWPDMGTPSMERAKKHIREAEAVLVELGEPFEPYEVKEAADAGKY